MIEFLETIHWGVVLQIIAIDILLGGDNAVVIGLACRNLNTQQRMKGIIWGTTGAILIRIVFVFFAMTLLAIPFLKAIGAILLLWIGIKLLLPEDEEQDNIQSSTNLWGAVRTIIIADVVMSLDNVIAIAGAAQNTHLDHQMFYVIFGLLVSVPIIVWGSTIILKLMDRFSFVIIAGAGLLGWIAGGMFVSDEKVHEWINVTFVTNEHFLRLAAQIIGIILVVGFGLLFSHLKKKKLKTSH